MTFKKVPTIDASQFPHYFNPEFAKHYLDYYEVKVSFKTTAAGLIKKMGLKPGEEWRLFVAASKSSVEEMVAEMDEFGVKYVLVIAGKIWSQRGHALWMDYRIETVGEAVQKSGGRLIGAASYNPFRITESLREIEKAVKEYGFKYVWFHPISFGLRPDDRRCYPLYSKCVELDIPVGMQVGHSAEPLTSEPGHPMAADNVAIDFPELTLVLTHTGWPWVDEWISMIRRHPNVYGMVNAYFPSQLDEHVIKFMESGIGREKVLWGSHGFGYERWLKEFWELPIREEAKLKILWDNALKVFRLSG